MWSLQQRLGLDLGALGPVSITLLLAALVGVLFRYLRWVTESPVLALALSLGITLALCASFVPQVKAAEIELGYVASFLLAATWVVGHARANRSARKAPGTKGASRLPAQGAIKTIEGALRKSLGTFPARHIRQLGKGLGKTLKQSRKRLKKDHCSGTASLKLENELLSLEREGNTLSEHLRRLQELDRALKRLDFGWLRETYDVGRHLAMQGQRRALWRQLKVERKRLGIDEKLEVVTGQGLSQLEDLKRHLEQCRRLLRQGNQKSLKREMSQARGCGREATRRYYQAGQLERQLLGLYREQEKRLLR